MKRSLVIQNSNEKNQFTNSAKQQRKRSLEDNGYMTKSKKRRHLSPQHDHQAKSSSTVKIKSKKRSSLRNSITEKKNNNHISRKSSSSRHRTFSTKHLTEITLPTWECISPNIDQILSNKHTQSGVYAHEVHLVQQELEALLSMSIVRENLLKDLRHPTKSVNTDTIRSKIRQHQQAEYIYSSKKTPSKPLPPLINQPQQRQNGPQLLLDRQVSLTPVIGARIDKIWSDMNSYYHRVSSNDLTVITKLVEFNRQLEEKIQQYKTEYQNHVLTQSNISEQLNEENFQELINIAQINPLITHYIDRTSIGRFQKKVYEQVPHTSPVYKTPISSPFYRKSLGNYLDNHSSLRSSPRLNANHRIGLGSALNSQSNDNSDQSSLFKSKKGTTIHSTSPSSSMNFQERVQLVHDYLTDQHPLINERVKRQLFTDVRSTRKRKSSITIHNDQCTDSFESKLSTLIALLHESSVLTSSALNRARLQSTNEQTWQKLNTIEHDLELLIQKIEITGAAGGGNNSSANVEKSLDHLLKDWKKYEDVFDRQVEQLLTDNN